jgi:protein-L-isoaspartate(D-aspartate) O-methyltransferase
MLTENRIESSSRNISMRTVSLWACLLPLIVLMATAAMTCVGKWGANESYEEQREKMVSEQILSRGIKDQRVSNAMRQVPRHLFVSPDIAGIAYEDRPLPIGHGQTISQPYIVALMTELAQLGAKDRVLEIGTGSGYQAAILSRLAGQIYTIEYIEPLGLEASRRLKDLHYENVEVRVGDGYQGWSEHQPFDAILVTAAIEQVPQPLLDQLKPGGRLIIPLGAETESQSLVVIEKDRQGEMRRREVIPVRFVPFLGRKGKPPE